MARRYLAALVDVLSRPLCLIALILLSPLLVVIATAILLTMGRPVIIRQLRSGRHGVPFTILKFRTMRPARWPEEDDEVRITPLGHFLRASSADELLTLMNVVTGDMALVGPRPFLAEYALRYDVVQRRRLEVKPGITGLSQISGRNRLTWSEKFSYDVWYVDHKTPLLDLKIMLRTPAALLRRQDLHHGTHSTMPVFEGERRSEPAVEPQAPESEGPTG